MRSNSSEPRGVSNVTGQLEEFAHLPFTLLYAVIIVLGFLFNAGALWVFSRHIRLRSGTAVYMRNLATADLLLVCFLPFRITSYYQRNTSTRLACEITTLIFLINMYTSIFFLACISLDRCVATLLPLRLPLRRLHRAAPWVSALVWTLSVSASLPPYFILKFSGGSNNTSDNCLRPVAVTKRLTVGFTLCIGFGLPFCLLIVCSLLALRQLRKGKSQGSQLLKAHKTQRMIVANLLIFTFCFLPYHALLCFYKGLEDRSQETAVQLFQGAQLLASSNAVLDPVLYYFTTEAFQKTHLVSAVRSLMTCRCWSVGSASARDRGKQPSEAVTFISVSKAL
ncbi:lysophosphatidic acid receptor 6-like [Pristis pectinata]|uniref:lysophosphatidic acid receptor 6-like n=1 Tax=Pristis pectinata TaxID=685728 RepID=UPI00223C9D0B|nr:lysophosphatidic acid receptor 6-like [Pristis pectinata]